MEKKYKIGMGFAIGLTAVGLLSTFITMSSGIKAMQCIGIAMFFLISFYAFIGYKKPHGNLLKCLMLAFAISLIFNINIAIQQNSVLQVVLLMMAIITIGYISGRLDRIQQNCYLMAVVLLFLIGATALAVFNASDFIRAIARTSDIIIWFDLCVAYFVRYKEHKEAGLMDAPKK